MKTVNKKARVEAAFEADAPKVSKFTKFKMGCEHIWKGTKNSIKVGTAIFGLGVIFAIASCGDAATTGGSKDAGVEVTDVGENTQKDANNVKDTGEIKDFGNPDKDAGTADTGNSTVWYPDGYEDKCTAKEDVNYNRICTSDKFTEIIYFSNVSDCGVKGDNGTAISCSTTYEGYPMDYNKNFTIYPADKNCVYATNNGIKDLDLRVPSGRKHDDGTEYALCNMGPIGGYSMTGNNLFFTKFVIRVLVFDKAIYDQIYNQN
jgi:hypothetical protein